MYCGRKTPDPELEPDEFGPWTFCETVGGAHDGELTYAVCPDCRELERDG